MTAATAKTIGAAWFVTGALLLAWSIRSFRWWSQSEERFSGPRDTILIFATFAVVALLGAAFVVRRVRAGRVLLLVLSSAAILYSGTFILFGGFDDTSSTYALCVLALFSLSLATILVRKRI
ncbi:MAG: hypothetical protein HYX75_02710 [Acidobacteria bacterium]|nr:hypothetical protein [Acidobacteriota bacterium]